MTATDLGVGKLANLVRYHCEQPPAKEEVRILDRDPNDLNPIRPQSSP